jgi:4-hydroxybenzoyl-CoA reductase subunit beta
MKVSQYLKPRTVKEAVRLAQKWEGDSVFLGGGTDVQIHRKQALESAGTLIDLYSIDTLRFIKKSRRGLRIGALTSIEAVKTSPLVKQTWPLLREAAAVIATPVIRKNATVGGNLLVRNRCSFYNQSEEWRQAVGSCLRDSGSTCQITGSTQKCYARNVSDLAPALMAMGAVVSYHDGAKVQKIPLEKIYQQDGLNPLRYFEGGSLLLEVEIPMVPPKWWFKKLRLRHSLDFTSLTVAGCRDGNDRIRIVVNGVSPAPVLVEGSVRPNTLEVFQRQVRKRCQTIDNDLFPLKYRREMMALYLKKCYHHLCV